MQALSVPSVLIQTPAGLVWLVLAWRQRIARIAAPHSVGQPCKGERGVDGGETTVQSCDLAPHCRTGSWCICECIEPLLPAATAARAQHGNSEQIGSVRSSCHIAVIQLRAHAHQRGCFLRRQCHAELELAPAGPAGQICKLALQQQLTFKSHQSPSHEDRSSGT